MTALTDGGVSQMITPFKGPCNETLTKANLPLHDRHYRVITNPAIGVSSIALAGKGRGVSHSSQSDPLPVSFVDVATMANWKS